MTAITHLGRVAPSSPRWPFAWLSRRRLALLASERKAAIGVALLAAPLTGLAVAVAMPRGPVTTAQALSLMALGSALGLLTGFVLRSRWAMLLAPVGYAAFFELGWRSSQGPTVDGIHLGSIWGIAAVVIGRGFHGVVVLAPMVVGAVVGAALARRRVPVARRAGKWRYVRGTVTVLASGALAGLAVLIAQPATVPPVLAANGQAVPGSIAELAKVKIGGVTQWLEIRGQSRAKPVLLFIPGGPGQSDLSFSRVLFANLTQDFIVVAWDGRGIGKAYPSFDPKTLTTDRVVADTIEVTNYLRRRFDEKKIYLAGESGGTVTGVLAVKRHPELYYAWIGSGQMVDPRETDLRIQRSLVAYATRVGDHGALEALRGYGLPPYKTPLAYAYVMGYYDKLAGNYTPPKAYSDLGKKSGISLYGIMGSEYGLVDKVNVLRGLIDTYAALYPHWQQIDFRKTAARLQVPVYLFEGSHELAGRLDLARQWFASLKAPRKHFYLFANAGHSTAYEQFQAFERILTKTVLPETYGTQPSLRKGQR